MQLRSFGFVRITAGRDQGAYYHELFIRGQPGLLHFLNKVNVEGLMKSTTPDFYDNEHIFPVDAECSTPPPNPKIADDGCVGVVNASVDIDESWLIEIFSKDDFEEQQDSLNSEAVPQAESSPVGGMTKSLDGNDHLPAASYVIGPLRPPGRLMYQPASKPAALRFVAASSQPDLQHTELTRWTRPLEANVVSPVLESKSRRRFASKAFGTPAHGATKQTTNIYFAGETPEPTLEELVLWG